MKLVSYKYLLTVALSLTLFSCVNSETSEAFEELNDKMEAGNEIITGEMEESYKSFNNAIDEINTTSGAIKDLEKIKQIQKQAIYIKDLSKSLNNFYIQQTSDLIKFSKDSNFGIKEEGGTQYSNHYEIDEDEYFQLFPLKHLKQKDNYEAATGLFVGKNIKNPSGQFLVDSMLSYRNKICKIVANYTDDNGQEWKFNPLNIQIETAKNSIAEHEFHTQLEKSISSVNPADTALIKQLYEILTPPVKVEHHGESVYWIVKQFDQAPLVAAIAILTSFRSDVTIAENKAVTHIAGRVALPEFDFNKIEPLAFAPENVINLEDTNK